MFTAALRTGNDSRSLGLRSSRGRKERGMRSPVGAEA